MSKTRYYQQILIADYRPTAAALESVVSVMNSMPDTLRPNRYGPDSRSAFTGEVTDAMWGMYTRDGAMGAGVVPFSRVNARGRPEATCTLRWAKGDEGVTAVVTGAREFASLPKMVREMDELDGGFERLALLGPDFGRQVFASVGDVGFWQDVAGVQDLYSGFPRPGYRLLLPDWMIEDEGGFDSGVGCRRVPGGSVVLWLTEMSPRDFAAFPESSMDELKDAVSPFVVGGQYDQLRVKAGSPTWPNVPEDESRFWCADGSTYERSRDAWVEWSDDAAASEGLVFKSPRASVDEVISVLDGILSSEAGDQFKAGLILAWWYRACGLRDAGLYNTMQGVRLRFDHSGDPETGGLRLYPLSMAVQLQQVDSSRRMAGLRDILEWGVGGT